jgi:hypothetical protein
MVKAELINYTVWLVAMGGMKQAKDTKDIISPKKKLMNGCA